MVEHVTSNPVGAGRDALEVLHGVGDVLRADADFLQDRAARHAQKFNIFSSDWPKEL